MNHGIRATVQLNQRCSALSMTVYAEKLTWSLALDDVNVLTRIWKTIRHGCPSSLECMQSETLGIKLPNLIPNYSETPISASPISLLSDTQLIPTWKYSWL